MTDGRKGQRGRQPTTLQQHLTPTLTGPSPHTHARCYNLERKPGVCTGHPSPALTSIGDWKGTYRSQQHSSPFLHISMLPWPGAPHCSDEAKIDRGGHISCNSLPGWGQEL